MTAVDRHKEAAGEAAAALVESGMTVGLGTGSTAAFFVRALARRAEGGLSLVGVPTSTATETLAASLGLRTIGLDEARTIDLTVDGADEIGPGLALIKGGGAALLREKLVWEASARCVVIADAAKVSSRLGRFPLPIEVVPFGARSTANRIADVMADHEIGAVPVLRMRDGRPVTTDGGNLIFDVACKAIARPSALALDIKGVTGVVDHGLFLDLAEEALVAGEDGVERLLP